MATETETLPSQPTLCDRIVAAHNAAYAATTATRQAAAEYRQTAAIAVQKGDWKLAVEFQAKAEKLFDLSTTIYATMIGQ